MKGLFAPRVYAPRLTSSVIETVNETPESDFSVPGTTR